jgi:hypothetical protein
MSKYLLVIFGFLFANPCIASADMDKFCAGVLQAVSETVRRPDAVDGFASKSIRLSLKIKDGDPTKLYDKGYQEIMASRNANNLPEFKRNLYKCMNYEAGTNIDYSVLR